MACGEVSSVAQMDKSWFREKGQASLRELAGEKEGKSKVININVDMSKMQNSISQEWEIDEIVEKLKDKMTEAMNSFGSSVMEI